MEQKGAAPSVASKETNLALALCSRTGNYGRSCWIEWECKRWKSNISTMINTIHCITVCAHARARTHAFTNHWQPIVFWFRYGVSFQPISFWAVSDCVPCMNDYLPLRALRCFSCTVFNEPKCKAMDISCTKSQRKIVMLGKKDSCCISWFEEKMQHCTGHRGNYECVNYWRWNVPHS